MTAFVNGQSKPRSQWGLSAIAGPSIVNHALLHESDKSGILHGSKRLPNFVEGRSDPNFGYLSKTWFGPIFYRRLKISWKGISCPLGKIALTSMVMVFPSADIERVPVLFTWPLNLATMFTE